ncbi:hypothetical protein [Agromyces laixinhei]|uniref:hypothetical protein n=1 Tax=Agromyces laixinhei TaxID=2585717 RepID=UPI0012EE84B3|nr:hypothetical protein [Agromyces laixinhei]
MIDRADIRRRIASHSPEEPLKVSAQRAAFEALSEAQAAGAPGSAKAGLLVAYAEEYEAMKAAVDDLSTWGQD